MMIHSPRTKGSVRLICLFLDKMVMWDRNAELNEPGDPDGQSSEDIDDEDQDEGVASEAGSYFLYNRVIRESPAYAWFITSLRRQYTLQWSATPTPITAEKIRRSILKRLSPGKISRRRPPRQHEVVFRLPLKLLQGRERRNVRLSAEEEPSVGRISDLVTITSSSNQTQVATVEQFVTQAWPGYGTALLEIAQRVHHHSDAPHQIKTPQGFHIEGVLPDKTRLAAYIHDHRLFVIVVGSAYAIAECGEQLSWLACALRSPHEDSIACITPAITTYNPVLADDFPSLTPGHEHFFAWPPEYLERGAVLTGPQEKQALAAKADLADIICWLIPASDIARTELQILAKERPEYVTSRDDMKRIDATVPDVKPSGHAITLRFSSKVKDSATGGFRFGRNPSRCDICFANDPSRLSSNIHFRIYLNKYGNLLIEDQSMNGTFVDDRLLRGTSDVASSGRRLLTSGTAIAVLLHKPWGYLRFFVWCPIRASECETAYQENLLRYLKSRSELGTDPRTKEAWIGPPRHWTGDDKYKVSDVIGRGTFGRVYKVKPRFGDTLYYAAKELERDKLIRCSISQEDLEREMRFMQEIQHASRLSIPLRIQWHCADRDTAEYYALFRASRVGQ